MEIINKQTYISLKSDNIIYSDQSNYKDICKQIRAKNDNFVLITYCENDNIIEPINIPKNITKWFVTDLNLDHHKKESVPTGIEESSFGLHIPPILHESYLGIFNNGIHNIEEVNNIVSKSVRCSLIDKDLNIRAYPHLSEFMISSTEQEAYIALIGEAIPIVKNQHIFDMYHDTPILLVEKWEDINKSLLEQTRAVFKNKPFQMQTLTPEYWRQKIWEAAEH